MTLHPLLLFRLLPNIGIVLEAPPGIATHRVEDLAVLADLFEGERRLQHTVIAIRTKHWFALRVQSPLIRRAGAFGILLSGLA